jgi:hypothetical protein
LIDVVVVQARIFDWRGDVCGVELEGAAAKYNERAWRLITGDQRLTRRIEAVCERSFAS